MNTPTIVSAALSDKELQDSINRMVANFDKGLQDMLDHTNKKVKEINEALKGIGNVNFGAKGSNDGGVVKQTKAQNDFTDAVKKSTNEIKNQGKQGEMSFDQILAALQTAQREVRKWESHKTFSTQDLDKYQAALVRVVELDEKLKRAKGSETYTRFDELSKRTAFDAKATIRDLTAVDDRYKKLVADLKTQQAESAKAFNQQMRDAFKMPTANVDEVWKKIFKLRELLDKGTKSEFISSTQIKNVENLISKLHDMRREMESKAVPQSVANYIKKVGTVEDQLKLAFARANKIPTDQIDLAQAKLERLQALLRDMRERGILSNTQIASTEAEIRKLEQIIGQVNTAQQQTTRAAQRYTEEIRKQAAEIRKMPEWKQGKDIRVSTPSGYDAVVNSHKKLSLEEQLLKVYMMEDDSLGQLVRLEQSSELKSKEKLGTEKQITEEIKKQQKAYESPFMYNQVVNKGSLRGLAMDKLGLDKGAIVTSDATSSLKNVNAELKQLQETYQRMTAFERNSPWGQVLRQRMQEVQRQSQQLNAQLSRPVDLKSAMGLSEKTLDDIAYKMRQLASYRSGLNIKTQANEIDQVNRKYADLQKSMNKIMQKNNSLIASNTALGRSWNYMKNRLAFYFTVGVSTQFVKNLINVRSEYEMNEKALGTLLNSAERGTRIFNELSNMALVSPYTLIELSAAAKQLTAYDIAAKDVVDTTRRLADISAAVGIPVERLTYALGQVKAYGHLTSQDARQFLNAGVPLVKELANRYSELEGKMVSTADIYDRMKKHAISYNDVLAVLTSMTDEGGRFFDYQAKMAETLKVRLANLTLAYNNMLNEIGKSEGGTLNSGIKMLTELLKHWREISRILATVVVSIGAYRAATLLAGITTKSAIGASAAAWLSTATSIRSAKDAVTFFSMAVKSVPFAGWVTAIASLVSYFVLFNNSADETKQKLQDIATAFEGIRKEATDLFVDAINTDSIGTQLTKLKDMLELAETELGVTIPINLEDVNESNVKQKLREAKNTIDNYINFSQTFSEAAVGSRFNDEMVEFGTTARSVYTSVSESVNSVKEALQSLADQGRLNKRGVEILKELDEKPKEGESRIEYIQRLLNLYERLGIIGEKKVRPMIGENFFLAYFKSTTDNMEELGLKQEKVLDKLGIKNKTVFETMLNDVQGYYSKSSIAAYQLELQIERVAKRINLEDIPKEERTAKLEVAINQEAAKNNWNEFAIQYAKWVANQKFGLNIAISEESKKDSEIELSDWQKRMQAWADKNGITFSLNFMEKEDEKTYADRMLQAAKDAQGRLDVQRRKLGVGTGSQAAVDAAVDEYKKARILASQAGADLSSLDKKTSSSRRSAAKAESELAKILRDELSTIDKVRSIYKDLTKSGMSHADAVERATKGWDETVNAINKVLQKNGLQKLDLSKFAGIENPRELVNMLQSQLNTLLKRGAKPAEIKELQTKIQTLNVDAEKYDLTKITKGLNNELGKLKDEYELAVELDANPELGGMFADFMGINMDELPKTFQEATKKAQEYIDKVFQDNGRTDRIDIASMLDKESFDNWVKDSGLKMDSELVKSVEAFRQYLHKIQVDETKKQIDEWSKLLEKYAEYEYKRKQILDTYEREMDVARKQNADKAIRDAIERRKNEQLAELDFNEFMKTPEWIVATGDLAGMSKQAIDMLIEEIEKYKKTARNLSPKQIHNLNKALKNLYKEQRKNNPFRAISNMLEEARGRAEAFDEEIEKVQKEIQDLTFQKSAELAAGIVNEDTNKRLTDAIERLKELKKNKENLGKIDASDWVQSINDTITAVRAAVSVFDDLAKAIGGVKGNSDIDKIFSVLEKGGQGAAIGAQFGGYGAIIGAVAGVATGIISTFADQWSGNASITKAIQDSEHEVRKLELAYIDLEHAVNEAYGDAEIGAKQAVIANKKLQLAELQRQLALEKSRSSKNRDEERIIEIQKQIKELEYEISDATKDIVNDLLGISSVGDFAENLVSQMIEAFKNGEDYMEKFEESFDDMIDNMIMKAIVSRVIGDRIEQIFDYLDSQIKSDSQGLYDEKSALEQERERLKEGFENLEKNPVTKEMFGEITRMYKDKLRDLDNRIEEINRQINEAGSQSITPEMTEDVRDMVSGMKDNVREEFLALMDAFGITYGQSSSGKDLSQLQQGIQGITEVTANALEAYANGISQQVYLHSELLTQIRDAIIGTNSDIQLGVQGQMLLQLQQSYQVQMSIQGILEGVLVPSGRAFAVELMS